MSHDYLMYVLKGFGVLGLISLSALRTILATDPVTTAVGGAVTLIGLAALIWKLVTDHRVEQDQAKRYDRMLTRADERITQLERENARLNAILTRRLEAAEDDA